MGGREDTKVLESLRLYCFLLSRKGFPGVETLSAKGGAGAPGKEGTNAVNMPAVPGDPGWARRPGRIPPAPGSGGESTRRAADERRVGRPSARSAPSHRVGSLPDPGDQVDRLDHDLVRARAGASSCRRRGAIGVYGASGDPRRGRRRRVRQRRATTHRKAFYIGNLAVLAFGQISPLKPALGSKIPPEGATA